MENSLHRLRMIELLARVQSPIKDFDLKSIESAVEVLKKINKIIAEEAEKLR